MTLFQCREATAPSTEAEAREVESPVEKFTLITPPGLPPSAAPATTIKTKQEAKIKYRFLQLKRASFARQSDPASIFDQKPGQVGVCTRAEKDRRLLSYHAQRSKAWKAVQCSWSNQWTFNHENRGFSARSLRR